ncbi:alpha-glucuronidase family glycosyl hydrolase [Paenibacillus crassostreae]|uniref:Xylan alpha-1,2-glucuronidase n=1 Tax=Paenibacillus crassostreae TaxID=1763538 RepID=A0A162KXC4_9BACL|nr:alpha-glucuronidase family glycosyl hydrolase [Paenibacillus crassostreae]AOZ93066.1 alpha-glucuronidase [Paenibacillus crassostreae]OAB71845.1 alpha-glucuronidase [Paenibacillus crassostreae]
MESTLYKAWLQYSEVKNPASRVTYTKLLGNVVVGVEATDDVMDAAIEELALASATMLGLTSQVTTEPTGASYVRIGTVTDAMDWLELAGDHESSASIKQDLKGLSTEGFVLRQIVEKQDSYVLLIGGSSKGVLYGVFHLLRLIAKGVELEGLEIREEPTNQLRMINQWDNADGSIERGYAGTSIFYHNGEITEHLARIKDYARMLASVGINSIAINNVNVHEVETRFITPELLPDVARVAGVFREYGISLFLSVNFAAPMQVGGLTTADPLDEGVRLWWRNTTDTIYRSIPDFGGFLVKADSEHRPGPFTYDRDHADGANVLAEALEPHGGIVIWRCFVYNCMQDWRDRSTDRARAAYDHFKPLDGKFKDNVLLQIKNGPMDFQVREPASPLFGTMKQTNQMLEFQITQEYTGQQRHVCYLVPQWKEVLDFDTHANGQGTEVKRVVDGSVFSMKYSGIAAVSNIGNDENWTGHTLAQANLYGYGRLIWNPECSSEDIAEEWARLTFGNDDQVVGIVCGILMKSWPIYESYTAPLSVGWMVTPHYHYGPDIDGYEYSRWGTYHFADRDGIGVDRTLATGTGYAAQYFPENAAMYESIESCPDELLLFFHHLPYSHQLDSGKTVIQHIYDTHFAGAEEAKQLQKAWSELEGKVDAERYTQVSERLDEQAEHAHHWRDVINTYFYRKSGVSDAAGRTIY